MKTLKERWENTDREKKIQKLKEIYEDWKQTKGYEDKKVKSEKKLEYRKQMQTSTF